MSDQEWQRLTEALQHLAEGGPQHCPAPASPEIAPAFEALETLRETVQQLEDFALALANGDLDAKTPPRKNHLASGLRQLHAQLRHLTWQAQCVARGDYNQRIDYMGGFSEAFNSMVAQLRDREALFIAQRDTMMRIFDSVDPIIIRDPALKNTVLYANQMARAHFGIAGQQSCLYRLSPVMRAIFAVPPSGEPVEILDDRSHRWYSVTTSHLHWTQDQQALLYHCIDITAHKLREKQLSLHAHTDPLTGVLNRRGFDDALAGAWDSCLQAQTPISVLMFDIDFFKLCNDRYGHPHGDRCLSAFGRLLTHSFVRPDDIVARYGGEEFIAILPNTGRENALFVAEKVRSATESLPIQIHGQEPNVMHVTVSCGLSCIVPMRGDTPAKWIADADRALYAAKQGGRNQTACLDPDFL